MTAAAKTRTLIRIPAILSTLVLCAALAIPSAARDRDRKKDDRWNNYDTEIIIRPEGDAESPAGTTGTTPPAGNQVPQTGESAPKVEVSDPAIAAPGNSVTPNIVPPQPAGEGEGPAVAERVDPKRDNLEQAKKMLEDQLERLRKAREARNKEAGQGAPAPVQAAKDEPLTGVERDVMILYLDPAEARPEVGDRFAATVRMANQTGKEFDEIGFRLRYDPHVLRVVDGEEGEEGINIHDRSFRNQFPWEKAEEYVNQVDQDEGLVSYRSRWKDSVPLTSTGSLASVTFEVIQARDTAISFEFLEPEGSSGGVADASPETFVRFRGKDVLGQTNDPADGAVDAKVKFYDYPVTGTDEAMPPRERQDLLTRVAVYPSVESVSEGEEFDYMIEIDNPNRVDFDEITLLLGFDPRHLTPMDHDRGNYIRNGVNVFDGEYHEEFPWNHHRRNEINPHKGYILYKMGTLRSSLNGSGVVASVRFRARSATGERGTRLKVGFVDDVMESGLTRRGRDVLGDPDEKRDGFETYPVLIFPEAVSQK
jgi:hypothetical protein